MPTLYDASKGNAPRKLINKLIVSQKRSIRTISHAAYLAHTNDLFKGLKLLKVDDINILESIKFAKKELLKPFSPYFTPRNNNHDMVLRGNLNLNVNLPRPRTDIDRRFITYSGAISWNNLPRALKSINHPVTFKKNIKNYILTRY